LVSPHRAHTWSGEGKVVSWFIGSKLGFWDWLECSRCHIPNSDSVECYMQHCNAHRKFLFKLFIMKSSPWWWRQGFDILHHYTALEPRRPQPELASLWKLHTSSKKWLIMGKNVHDKLWMSLQLKLTFQTFL
jgi:hypothetical protein